MSKREEFSAALKDAMKNKDAVATSTLRLIIAAMKDRDVNSRTDGRNEGIGDSEILSMLQSMIKQRQESSETYRNAGRNDLAEREDAEIKIIEGFLPRQLGEAEIRTAVQGVISEMGVSGIKEMGRVMAEVKNRYAGQMDMTRASAMVKETLSAA